MFSGKIFKIMKKNEFNFLFVGIFLILFGITANAQNQKSTTEKILTAAGKATVTIVGETAKATYGVSKFTAKTAIKPVAKSILKPLVVKVMPKTVGFLVEKSIPVGKKLFLTYLKTRLTL